MTCSVDKKEFVDDVLKLWEKYPELRFGQLLANFVFPRGTEGQSRVFYQDDEISLDKINLATEDMDKFMVLLNKEYADFIKGRPAICSMCHVAFENTDTYIETRNRDESYGKYHVGCFRKKFIDVDSKY